MKKIISLFQRNYDGDRLVRNEIVPGAEWVAAGEGVATRKWDGTCCMVRGGQLFKRHEIKPGGKRPGNFEPANETDEATGKQQGWLPVGEGQEDQWHRDAFRGGKDHADLQIADGTYELIGPKIQGNPEGLNYHILVLHGAYELVGCPRDFKGLKGYLENARIEGIVWHHPDGRMVKIKAKDFGIKRR
jgi:hypothetical protein